MAGPRENEEREGQEGEVQERIKGKNEKRCRGGMQTGPCRQHTRQAPAPSSSHRSIFACLNPGGPLRRSASRLGV